MGSETLVAVMVIIWLAADHGGSGVIPLAAELEFATMPILGLTVHVNDAVRGIGNEAVNCC